MVLLEKGKTTYFPEEHCMCSDGEQMEQSALNTEFAATLKKFLR